MNKNLFELSQEEKNKIRGLHESYKNKPGTKLIWEQSETDELKRLNNRIAEVIQSKQAEILSQVKISLLQEEVGVVIKTNYQSKKYITKKTYGNEYSTGNFNENIYLEAVPLSKYITEIIGSDANFLKLYNEPSIKNQVNQMMIPTRIYSEGTGANISINPIKNSRKFRKDPRYHETEATWNTEMGTGSNIYLFPINNKTIAAVQLGGLAIQLGNVALQRTNPIPDDDIVTAPEYSFELKDIFKFDDVALKEGDASLNTAIEDFIQFMSTAVEEGKHLEILDTDVKILGYASSDGDPNEKDGGNLQACSQYGKGKGPRGEYDKCLSQKRAEVVTNKINEALKNIGINYAGTQSTLGALYPNKTSNWAKAVGMGQNSDVSGIKWDTPGHTVEKTAPDRRVVFTPKLTFKGNTK